MVGSHLSNSPLKVSVFVSMQSYLDGVKQVDGGIALAMESFALMIKRAHSGQLRRRPLAH